MNSHKKAFTLIELLIVIAIIGILAVALLPAITGAPARARDAARLAAVNNIINALEVGYGVGRYPAQASVATADCLDFTATSGAASVIRDAMVAAPTVSTAGAILCSTSTEQFFYKSFSTTSYMLAVQFEQRGSANYDSAVGDSGVVLRGLGSVSAVISATDGSPPDTGPFFYVIAR